MQEVMESVSFWLVCLGDNILVMDLEETEARKGCAGEVQQQFNRPTDEESVQ
jgi:hypothetical protein